MSAEDFVPYQAKTVAELRLAAEHCEGCDLFKAANQTVFGEGKARRPSLMLVGEQPGDVEDKTGRPFVGPAGSVLNKALEGLGITRSQLYLTNAVKHFKWQPQGSRRLHKTPSARETAACRPWLMAEIRTVRPRVVVCLGGTAAQSLLGPSFRVTQHRGELLNGPEGHRIVATVHPASIVRLRGSQERQAAFTLFVLDLRSAVEHATSAETT
jgi:uracil-DNA glycosylase